MNVGILSWKRRKNVRALALSAGVKYAPNNERQRAEKARRWDIVVNWGNSYLNFEPCEHQRILNRPESVGIAVNKRETFLELEKHGVRTLDWTTDIMEAKQWLSEGSWVMGREFLSASKGRGCTIFRPSGGLDIDTLKLYTKMLRKPREFRVHIWGEEVSLYTQKKRRRGYNNNAQFNPHIRTHDSGWVFCPGTDKHVLAIKEIACEALSALTLDFGAVDVLYHKETPYILEINTAPGIQGRSTLEAYRRRIECLKKH